MSDTLLIERGARGVVTVTMNRPQVHNAFDAAQIALVTEAFTTLAGDDSVRVVVLRGAGKSFCAGGDLNWMRAMKDYSAAENKADAEKLAAMFVALRRFPRPLIGVVQGIAFGGGSGLVSLCDFVVAAEGAKFGFTETKLGLLPATISPFVIEKIGFSHAKARFISGAPFSAQEALVMGLVHRVVSMDELESAAREAVAQFLAAGPKAAMAAKAMIDEVMGRVCEAGDACDAKVVEYTASLIASVRASSEAQEGMGAVLEGNKPGWQA